LANILPGRFGRRQRALVCRGHTREDRAVNTPTHVLLAAAIFAHPRARARSAAAILGAVVPDLSTYALWLWSKLGGIPEARVWGEVFHAAPWRDLADASHSVPLYGAVLLAAFLLPRGAEHTGRAVAVFAWAALLHIAADLPLHVDDAHAHLWPFSDWRFVSPVSYWNRGHYGHIWAPIEGGLALALIAVLWLRFRPRWVRAALVLAALSYVAVPAYFSAMHG
jgi:hypothetical protein